jgi:hypothetical protein
VDERDLSAAVGAAIESRLRVVVLGHFDALTAVGAAIAAAV